MARTLELKQQTGLTLSVEVVARGANAITETITMTEKTVAKQVYTGTIASATAGEYELNLKVGSNYIGTDEVVVNGTDGTTSRARSVTKPEWPPLNPTETAQLTGTTVASVTNLAYLASALTQSYRSAGAEGTLQQLLYEILQNLTEFAISGTTKTVKKLDGSTTAKTYTLNDATNPTSITETT